MNFLRILFCSCFSISIAAQIHWEPAGQLPAGYEPVKFQKDTSGNILLLCRRDSSNLASTHLFQSNDDGENWNKINMSGLPPMDPTGFIVLSDRMLVSGRKDLVFTSFDGGNSWAASNTGIKDVTYWVSEIGELQNGHLRLGTTNHCCSGYHHLMFFRSDDSGSTWTLENLQSLFNYTRPTAMEFSSDTLLMAVYTFTPLPGNYFPLLNTGSGWTKIQGEFPERFRINDFLKLSHNEVIAVGEVRTTSDLADGIGLYLSKDRVHWDSIPFTGISTLTSAIAIIDTPKGTLLAGTTASQSSAIFRAQGPLAVTEITYYPTELFPNPASEYFEFPDIRALDLLTVEIYDSKGARVSIINSDFDRIRVSGLPAGSYAIRYTTRNNFTGAAKLIKQ